MLARHQGNAPEAYSSIQQQHYILLLYQVHDISPVTRGKKRAVISPSGVRTCWATAGAVLVHGVFKVLITNQGRVQQQYEYHNIICKVPVTPFLLSWSWVASSVILYVYRIYACEYSHRSIYSYGYMYEHSCRMYDDTCFVSMMRDIPCLAGARRHRVPFMAFHGPIYGLCTCLHTQTCTRTSSIICTNTIVYFE